jgi:hypothetical protein
VRTTRGRATGTGRTAFAAAGFAVVEGFIVAGAFTVAGTELGFLGVVGGVLVAGWLGVAPLVDDVPGA